MHSVFVSSNKVEPAEMALPTRFVAFTLASVSAAEKRQVDAAGFEIATYGSKRHVPQTVTEADLKQSLSHCVKLMGGDPNGPLMYFLDTAHGAAKGVVAGAEITLSTLCDSTICENVALENSTAIKAKSMEGQEELAIGWSSAIDDAKNKDVKHQGAEADGVDSEEWGD